MKLLIACAATLGCLHSFAGAIANGPRAFSMSTPADVTHGQQAGPDDRQELRAAAEREFAAGEQSRRLATSEGWSRAVGHYTEAARLFKAGGEPRRQAQSLLMLSSVHFNLGELQASLSDNSAALAVFREIGDRRGEAQVLNRLASLLTRLGQRDQGTDHLLEAIGVSRAAGDRPQEIFLLTNLALTYESDGDLAGALQVFRDVDAIARTSGDRRVEAETQRHLGRVHTLLGQPREALTYFERALSMAREAANRFLESRTHRELALLRAGSGDYAAAVDHLHVAVTIGREIGNTPGVLTANIALGQMYAATGRFVQALEHLGEAQAAAQGRHPRHEALIHLTRARVARQAGDLSAAQNAIEAGLAFVESQRSRIENDDLRATHGDATQRYFDFYVDLLMQRHARQPQEGYDAQALRGVERARARTLLELLNASHVQIREGADPALLEREQSLQALLNDAAEQLLQRPVGPQAVQQARDIEQRLEQLRAEYRDVRLRLEAASPKYAALTQPAPLSLAEIQTTLLDGGTLLLEYALGEERSYLWVVSHQELTTFVLPPRPQIEAAARRVHEALALQPGSGQALRPGSGQAPSGHHPGTARASAADDEVRRAAAELSDLVVKPAAALLRGHRLVIVPDGALHYVPFAALPDPRAPSQPLIVAHEIVNLPSASVLAVLREEAGKRPSPAAGAIVFADPVFGKDDPRVGAGRPAAGARPPQRPAPESVAPSATRALERSVAAVGLGESGVSIPRLPFTRREATAIAAALPRGQSRLALDFEASRATATGADLSRYRIVHFATHGVLNTEHPELSGLVLSLVDPRGGRQNGFLRLTDIFNLRLAADLVVLSGCQTGLGKELNGEGLIGLTRGFMYAGAPRVMASLWKVDDRATAELMQRTYEGMVGPQRLPAAAALRAAQIALLQQKRWTSPFYWAGFVVQGDWR